MHKRAPLLGTGTVLPCNAAELQQELRRLGQVKAIIATITIFTCCKDQTPKNWVIQYCTSQRSQHAYRARALLCCTLVC